MLEEPLGVQEVNPASTAGGQQLQVLGNVLTCGLTPHAMKGRLEEIPQLPMMLVKTVRDLQRGHD